MDEKFYNPVPGDIPSPEELFHKDNKEMKGAVSVSGRKPIPHYRVIKHFSIGFLIFIAFLFVLMMNLDRLGIHFYYMMSSSMESTIPKGSFLVEYKADADKLKEGDIITYISSEGTSITHEIVEVIPAYRGGKEPAFRTKGTENAVSDKEYVTYENVCGKVVIHIPYIGYFLSKI